MNYTATAKYLKISPRKVRLLADPIRGMKATVAFSSLLISKKHAAKLFLSVLRSAMANAKNHKVGDELLMVKTIDVSEGPAMKRWHAVSRGTAHAYKKRTTHIRIVLSDEQKEEKTKKIKVSSS